MKVSVIGTGYVGLSLAVLISRKYLVTAVDIVPEKIEMIRNGISPIADAEIEHYLKEKLNLEPTTDLYKCIGSDFIIIATPTNYNPETQYFDTSSVEKVIMEIEKLCSDTTIVIKSTIPIGFTKKFCNENQLENVIFSPEFLREGRALYDNLHPSRIVVGAPYPKIREKARAFSNLLVECAEDNPEVLITGSTEAESIKLFSNTYLAMRVAYFNELDTFAEMHDLSSKDIIDGVCMDPRIGNHYNNPSFGYGGYCLPKDTKQLLANYYDTPNSLMCAIVQSNITRKKFIVDSIEKRLKEVKDPVIGIYRLTMKSGSDNFRDASILDIIGMLKKDGFDIIIYEPMANAKKLEQCIIEADIISFINGSDIIIANRITDDLSDVAEKVYCRDIFLRD